jgi:hypothetical protein
MGTDKPRISTVAPLAAKVVALEQGILEVAIGLAQDLELGTSELEIALAGELALEAGLEPIVRVASEHKILGPVIGPVAGPAREISVAAIALAVAQVRAARVAEPARCRQAAAVAQIASVIGLSHPAQDSDPVAALSAAAVGLGATPLGRPVVAEAPAWAVAVLVVAEEAAAADAAAVVVVVGAGDK